MTKAPFVAALGTALALFCAGTLAAQTATDDGKATDAVGLMVPADLGVTSALELSGATLCITAGSAAEAAVPDYFTANMMDYAPVVFETADEALEGYSAATCDALAADMALLETQRQQLPSPANHVVLPESLSPAADAK